MFPLCVLLMGCQLVGNVVCWRGKGTGEGVLAESGKEKGEVGVLRGWSAGPFFSLFEGVVGDYERRTREVGQSESFSKGRECSGPFLVGGQPIRVCRA